MLKKNQIEINIAQPVDELFKQKILKFMFDNDFHHFHSGTENSIFTMTFKAKEKS